MSSFNSLSQPSPSKTWSKSNHSNISSMVFVISWRLKKLRRLIDDYGLTDEWSLIMSQRMADKWFENRFWHCSGISLKYRLQLTSEVVDFVGYSWVNTFKLAAINTASLSRVMIRRPGHYFLDCESINILLKKPTFQCGHCKKTWIFCASSCSRTNISFGQRYQPYNWQPSVILWIRL